MSFYTFAFVLSIVGQGACANLQARQLQNGFWNSSSSSTSPSSTVWPAIGTGEVLPSQVDLSSSTAASSLQLSESDTSSASSASSSSSIPTTASSSQPVPGQVTSIQTPDSRTTASAYVSLTSSAPDSVSSVNASSIATAISSTTTVTVILETTVSSTASTWQVGISPSSVGSTVSSILSNSESSTQGPNSILSGYSGSLPTGGATTADSGSGGASSYSVTASTGTAATGNFGSSILLGLGYSGGPPTSNSSTEGQGSKVSSGYSGPGATGNPESEHAESSVLSTPPDSSSSVYIPVGSSGSAPVNPIQPTPGSSSYRLPIPPSKNPGGSADASGKYSGKYSFTYALNGTATSQTKGTGSAAPTESCSNTTTRLPPKPSPNDTCGGVTVNIPDATLDYWYTTAFDFAAATFSIQYNANDSSTGWTLLSATTTFNVTSALQSPTTYLDSTVITTGYNQTSTSYLTSVDTSPTPEYASTAVVTQTATRSVNATTGTGSAPLESAIITPPPASTVLAAGPHNSSLTALTNTHFVYFSEYALDTEHKTTHGNGSKACVTSRTVHTLNAPFAMYYDGDDPEGQDTVTGDLPSAFLRMLPAQLKFALGTFTAEPTLIVPVQVEYLAQAVLAEQTVIAASTEVAASEATSLDLGPTIAPGLLPSNGPILSVPQSFIFLKPSTASVGVTATSATKLDTNYYIVSPTSTTGKVEVTQKTLYTGPGPTKNPSGGSNTGSGSSDSGSGNDSGNSGSGSGSTGSGSQGNSGSDSSGSGNSGSGSNGSGNDSGNSGSGSGSTGSGSQGNSGSDSSGSGNSGSGSNGSGSSGSGSNSNSGSSGSNSGGSNSDGSSSGGSGSNSGGSSSSGNSGTNSGSSNSGSSNSGASNSGTNSGGSNSGGSNSGGSSSSGSSGSNSGNSNSGGPSSGGSNSGSNSGNSNSGGSSSGSSGSNSGDSSGSSGNNGGTGSDSGSNSGSGNSGTGSNSGSGNSGTGSNGGSGSNSGSGNNLVVVPVPIVVTIGDKSATVTPGSTFIFGSQTLAPGKAVTIGGTAVSLGPSAVVVGGETHTFPSSTAQAPGPIAPTAITYGGSVITQAPVPVYQVAGTTVRAGEVATISGTVVSAASTGGVLVIGSSTISLAVPDSPMTLSTAGKQVIVSPNPAFVIGGQTLQAGGSPITVDGTRLSLAPSAAAIVVGSQTSQLASPAGATRGALLTVGTKTFTADAVTRFSIAPGVTLTPGGSATVDGTVVHLGSGFLASLAAVGSSVQTLSPAIITPAPAFSFGGSVYQANGGSAFVIDGQTLTPGGVITVSGTTVSFASEGTAVVVNGVTQSLAQTTGAPALTVGGQTYTAQSGSFVIGGQTLTPGGVITVSGTTISLADGGSTAVINGITQPLTQATSVPVLSVGSETYTAESGSTFVIGGQTLTPGGIITVSGTTISLKNGATAVVNGVTQILAQATATPAITIGGQTYTAQSGSTYVIGGQTLAPGGIITVSGTTISLVNGATAVVNGVTQVLTQATPAPVLTIGGQTYTAQTGSTYVIGGQTLTPGGVITVSGTTISLEAGGTAAVVNGVTQMLTQATAAPVLTVGGRTYTAQSGSSYVIDGQTLTPGGVITLAGGTTVSLGNSGSFAVINGVTSTIPRVAATPTSVLTIGGRTYTATSGSYVINGQTLTQGGVITVSGTTLSLGASVLVINGQTSTLPLASATEVITIGSQTFTPLPGTGVHSYLVGSQTLRPGGTEVTYIVSGRTYILSLGAGASTVEIELVGPGGKVTATVFETLISGPRTATITSVQGGAAAGATSAPSAVATATGRDASLQNTGVRDGVVGISVAFAAILAGALAVLL